MALVPMMMADMAIDVSGAAYGSAWKCLKENGYTRAIPRCYESLGRPDTTCPHVIWPVACMYRLTLSNRPSTMRGLAG